VALRLACCVFVAALAVGAARAAAAPTGGVYAGLGSWLDIYAGRPWSDPDGLVARAKGNGVTTLYLQTSNYRQKAAIVRPFALGTFIDAAHAAGLRVVAWYLPGLSRPRLDAARALAAIRFRSESGQRFDGFALDIEASVVRDVQLRNERLLALSALLRRAAPHPYQLGAIIPSPVGIQRHPHYWPGFPYTALADSFDAFLPMAYFSHYAHTPDAAYAYAHDVIALLRSEVGTRVPIHMIGGSSAHMPGATLAGFVRAASQCGVAGVSLYAFPQTSAADWAALSAAHLGSRPTLRCASP
jgi:hypothetical protein